MAYFWRDGSVVDGWRTSSSFFSSSFFSSTLTSSFFSDYTLSFTEDFTSSFFSSSTLRRGSSVALKLDLTVLPAGMEVKVLPASAGVAGVYISACLLARCLPTLARFPPLPRPAPPLPPGPPLPRPRGAGLVSSLSFWTDAPLPRPLPPGGWPSFEPPFPRADVGVLLPFTLLIYDSNISYFFF